MSLPALPATLGPVAPFPLVTAQSMTSDFVAPGVRRATYRLQTTDGPLVINVVALDPREPTLHVRTVLANDRMISSGETIGAMAKRTGAIAGVNADYFDIGNTNQPLNLVVRDGALLRTPSKRVVFDIRADRSVHFENVGFSGTLRTATATFPVTSINEWPPQGGVGVLDDAYGTAKAAPGVRIMEMVPIDVEHPALHPGGAFRIAAEGDASRAHVVHGYELAFGPAALALAQPPPIGENVTLDLATTPPLDDLVQAVGGGPALVAHGAIVDDPNSPAPEERDRRFPVSGAATLRDGTLLLCEVDGRAATYSIGVTRPQFAALALAMGATDAMAFDSGGSAELVARELGDAHASVLGRPSDGEERAVADGVFAYSDAPVGPASRLVVRPSAIVALAGAVVPVRALLVDAAGHALGATHLARGDAVRARAVSARVPVRSGTLRTDVAVDVVDRLARIDLTTDVRHPEPGGVVRFRATGYDDRDREVMLGPALMMRGRSGPLDATRPYRLGMRDERFEATAAGALAQLVVHVGRHVVPIEAFDFAHRAAWRFAAAPATAPGSIAFADDAPEMRLVYDFTRDARAAYAQTALGLPGEPLAVSIDVTGDGGGAALRASFVNGLGETRALTLASRIDWRGVERKTVVLPDDVTPPVRLASLYIVPGVGGPPARVAGTIAFKNLTVTVAGNP